MKLAPNRLQRVHAAMFPPAHSPQFSSTIRVVSRDEFDRFNADELGWQNMVADTPWNYKSRVRQKPEGMTLGAFNCNAGGVQNGDKLMLFHLEPSELAADDGNLNETEDILANDILQLKRENPDLRAMLTGGDNSDEDSHVVKDMLLSLFAKFRIPTSVLWGANGTDVHYDTKTDTWTIALSDDDMPLTLEDFKARFPYVRIAPGDELYIEDEPFGADEVNQKPEEY